MRCITDDSLKPSWMGWDGEPGLLRRVPRRFHAGGNCRLRGQRLWRSCAGPGCWPSGESTWRHDEHMAYADDIRSSREPATEAVDIARAMKTAVANVGILFNNGKLEVCTNERAELVSLRYCVRHPARQHGVLMALVDIRLLMRRRPSVVRNWPVPSSGLCRSTC